MKKLIFVVIDGGADTPHPELGNKTPLQVADISNLNNFSRIGMNGAIQVLPVAPESDEAILSLLGFDVFQVYTGRGPLEAIGGGVTFKDGDIALRCNFGTIEDDKIVDVRAGKISTEEAHELANAVNEFVSLKDAKFIFKSTAGYRGVLIISSKEKLSARISNTHPGYFVEYIDIFNEKGIPISSAVTKPNLIYKKCFPLENTKEAIRAARLVNEFIEKSHFVLEKHPINVKRMSKGLKPANIILTRDAGDRIPKLFDFSKVYGMKWACFADMPVERGIAQLAGMQIIPLPEITDNVKKDMLIRATALIKNLVFYDAIYIHLKGPDPYSHMGNIKEKIKVLEAIDKYFFGQIIKHIDIRNTVLAITCDHATSTIQRAHTSDPVPLTVVGPHIIPDNVAGFNEYSCLQGALKLIHASSLMTMLIKLAKR